MKRKVTVAKLLLGTVQHRADAALLHVESFGQFFVGQSGGAQNKELSLSGLNRGQHGTHSPAFFFQQQRVQWTAGPGFPPDTSSSLFVLTAAAGSPQPIGPEVCRSSKRQTTAVSIDLPGGLAVQTPEHN